MMWFVIRNFFFFLIRPSEIIDSVEYRMYYLTELCLVLKLQLAMRLIPFFILVIFLCHFLHTKIYLSDQSHANAAAMIFCRVYPNYYSLLYPIFSPIGGTFLLLQCILVKFFPLSTVVLCIYANCCKKF